MKNSTLSLDIETLVELTPEDQANVNGGWQSLSSPMPMPSPATGVRPTPTAVSSARPPVKHHRHHKTVSSVMPTATAI
jgi:hypothetical protein